MLFFYSVGRLAPEWRVEVGAKRRGGGGGFSYEGGVMAKPLVPIELCYVVCNSGCIYTRRL